MHHMSSEVLLAWRCMLQQMVGVTYIDIVIRTKKPSDQQCRITDRHIVTQVDNRSISIVQLLLPCKTKVFTEWMAHEVMSI